MTRTRSVVLFCALAAALVSVSCRRHGRKGANQPGYEPAAQPAFDPAAQPAAVEAQPQAGTCEAACRHYLECKGIADPVASQSCLAKCAQAGYAPQVLASYVQTDCASAITIVEGAPAAGGSTGGSGSKDCQGCVWDGSSCIWMSSGNWGSGPYSGASTACDPSCCPGH